MWSQSIHVLVSVVVVAVIALLIYWVAAAEGLVSFRGMPSGRVSFGAKEWEDPIWSDMAAVRGVSAELDNCLADAVPADILRVGQADDPEFLRRRGIKLALPRHVSRANIHTETYAVPPKHDEAVSIHVAARMPPAIYSHGSPLLALNAPRRWDPVIVTASDYSIKM
jgi:hypothetical protein